MLPETFMVPTNSYLAFMRCERRGRSPFFQLLLSDNQSLVDIHILDEHLETTMSFIALLNIATTACIGLLVGSELFLTAFTNPVLGELDEPARLKAAHLLTARAATPLPLWNVLGLVLLIVQAVVHRHEPGFSLLVAASVLWAAAAAFTLTLMLPLNSRLARADSASSPKQSLLDYKRWSARHLPRLLVLAAALLCLLLASYA
jgi:uncharacterized membrane protein